MKFELKEYHRDTPDTELIEDLKRVGSSLNKDTVTRNEYDEQGRFNSATFVRRFSSWFKALKKAGFKKSRNLGVTDEDYFRNIEEVWIKLGRQPKYKEMKKPLSKYVAGAYDYRFGNWSKALKEFIKYINQDEKPEKATKPKETKGQKPLNIIKHKTNREISDRLRFRILMRDGFTCSKCGRSPMKERGIELHVDHIIPWSKGGETIPENLETKCQKCNLGKGNTFSV